MQRSFSGSFRVDRPTPGWWRVRNIQVPHQTAWLRNVRTTTGDVPVEQSLPDTFDALSLDWDAANPVTVVLGDGEIARILTADSMQLQEPDQGLYDALPLARFTPDARRFWQRIFWLVRLPGGRTLLGLVARVRRASDGNRAKPR
jgi:hypothetical protein